MFQVRKWFGNIVKPESESETFTLSSKFGAFSKPSEVRGLVIYSNVSPLVTPNFLSLSYYELPFLEGLGKCCFFFFLDDRLAFLILTILFLVTLLTHCA